MQHCEFIPLVLYCRAGAAMLYTCCCFLCASSTNLLPLGNHLYVHRPERCTLPREVSPCCQYISTGRGRDKAGDTGEEGINTLTDKSSLCFSPPRSLTGLLLSAEVQGEDSAALRRFALKNYSVFLQLPLDTSHPPLTHMLTHPPPPFHQTSSLFSLLPCSLLCSLPLLLHA